ncbi:sensor histidine kinase [Deinococcus yavapaiensis]|uniref:histidine kinase n=1 Tax=Deinococcus yavapaiensis KR-236 TaxID=694435 RepID=A0A318S201_9DEIO|nr:ATP-binding protein [Deinococcus yavapaiensis]PYE49389.1 PAS/PAC sensor hybrid histidine kinase [Deinococcus yavapaiensis KR-236]
MNKVPSADARVNILIVDDDPAKRLALSAALESLGENLVQAESGRDALRLLLQHDFALILLDVRMPDMDGFETAALIRSRPQTESTPIIFVTAYDRAEADTLGGYALGAVDFIFAPIVPEVLRAKVGVFVDLHHKTRAIAAHERALREREAREAQLTSERLRRQNERDRERAAREVHKLSSALEQTDDPVVITDRDGRIEYVNPAFERLTGYARIETLGQRLTLVRSGEPDPGFNESLWSTLLAGEVYRGEFVNRRKDGTLYHEEQTITPIKDESGRITHFVATGKDVSERKRVEREIRHLNASLEARVRERTARLQDLNHELEAFAYSVSHDLRTPLRHIASFANLLAKEVQGAENSKAEQYLEIIEKATLKMNGLIEDLLAYSRTGRQDLRLVDVSVADLVAEVRRDLARDEVGRRVEWHVGDLPVVRADLAAFRQVFANLLGNALKYTRARDVAVIEVGSFEEDEAQVLFVRDNGVGFDEKYADKLFGVFQRLHTGGEFEGTGIGLANVKRIVTRHGGRVWAESRVQEGTTFYVALPKVHEASVKVAVNEERPLSR